ncbi:MAG: DUF1569 domain-containing protein [Planctomycetaceae bacterium]
MERRQLRIQHLNEAIVIAEDLAKRSHQRAGQWDLAQILSHLNRTMTMSLQGTDWGLPRLLRPVMKWLFMGRVRSGRSHSLSMKATAPPSLTPDDQADPAAELDQFRQLCAKVESDETTFIDEHPVFGRIAAEDWRSTHRWHAAHHLSFLVPD